MRHLFSMSVSPFFEQKTLKICYIIREIINRLVQNYI